MDCVKGRIPSLGRALLRGIFGTKTTQFHPSSSPYLMASSNAAAASDPLASTPSPRAARPGRQPRSHLVPGDPEAPPSPSSTPSPPTAAAIPSSDALDRSPQRPPVEDVAPSSSDVARGKKPAWKRPPNGSIEAGAVVMGGAASWPALSESAKTTSKSPSSDALKALSDGPLSAPPVRFSRFWQRTP